MLTDINLSTFYGTLLLVQEFTVITVKTFKKTRSTYTGKTKIISAKRTASNGNRTQDFLMLNALLTELSKHMLDRRYLKWTSFHAPLNILDLDQREEH